MFGLVLTWQPVLSVVCADCAPRSRRGKRERHTPDPLSHSAMQARRVVVVGLLAIASTIAGCTAEEDYYRTLVGSLPLPT